MAKAHTILFLVVLSAFSSMATAEGLPKAGACDRRDTFAPNFLGLDLVEWEGSHATVSTSADIYDGWVVGMREHGDGFKLSIRYRDRIMGASEVVIFELPTGGLSTYRLGVVHFDELEDGNTVVSAISGFQDVNCVVLR
jgi:hypothetical protein